jgi:hypothetical protein
MESDSTRFKIRGQGVIDPGGHYLESAEESPWLYSCEPCGFTLMMHTYAAQNRTGTICGKCGTEVVEGPKEGYVCGNCYYIVSPDE